MDEKSHCAATSKSVYKSSRKEMYSSDSSSSATIRFAINSNNTLKFDREDYRSSLLPSIT